MFRPQASLPLRIARMVLVPSGPLILMVVIANLSLMPADVAGELLVISMVWFFCAWILVPALTYRGPDSSSGPSDGGDGGDGGSPRKPRPPGPGLGGIPLPDAAPSRDRIRDHVRPERQWWRRRTAREPGHAPVPGKAD